MVYIILSDTARLFVVLIPHVRLERRGLIFFWQQRDRTQSADFERFPFAFDFRVFLFPLFSVACASARKDYVLTDNLSALLLWLMANAAIEQSVVANVIARRFFLICRLRMDRFEQRRFHFFHENTFFLLQKNSSSRHLAASSVFLVVGCAAGYLIFPHSHLFSFSHFAGFGINRPFSCRHWSEFVCRSTARRISSNSAASGLIFRQVFQREDIWIQQKSAICILNGRRSNISCYPYKQNNAD